MRINTSLRLLVITGAFLSAEAALAQNSFSTVQVLVANNTLTTQLLGVNNVDIPTSVNVHAEQTSQDIGMASRIDPTPAASTNQGQVVFKTASPMASQSQQFGLDEDHSTAIPFQPSRSLASARSTQETGFSSDVANMRQHPQLSGVPIQVTSSEVSVEIFVPRPRTQIIKVPSVTRLPRAVKTRAIPTVAVIPVVQPSRGISPTPNVTNFSQTVASEPINVPQPNNVPAVPTLPNGSHAELIYPLMNPAPVTSRFGWRTHPLTGSRRFHSGIDIGAASGTPVVATAAGTVVSAGWNGGYGKAIIIQHNDVQQTLYGHLSEISVQPGQQIAQGSVIGLVGSTGNSTGPHLHFESRSPGANNAWVAVDPTQDVQYAMDNLRRSMPYAGKDSPQGL
jgi:murein DD-endopeptidase MepM/ murein hydrolase activator NlpD